MEIHHFGPFTWGGEPQGGKETLLSTLSLILMAHCHLDAMQSFVLVLKSRFCKWLSRNETKVVRAGQLWSRRRYVSSSNKWLHSSLAKSINKYYFSWNMEVDDESIDISGLPERNVYGSVRCRGNVTKYTRAFKFIIVNGR